jgi:peptide/nickel transport system permease protein
MTIVKRSPTSRSNAPNGLIPHPSSLIPSTPLPRRRGWTDRLRAAPLSIKLCLAVLALFVLCAAAADLIAPHDPTAQQLRARLRPPVWAGGTAEYPLGTDALGRDVLSRLIVGARVSIAIGVAGMLIGLVLGTASGLLSGFLRGPVDEATMFLVDCFLAIPFLVIMLTGVAVLGRSLAVLILLAGISGWATYTRVARGIALSAREQPYILAARALGAGPGRLLLRHVLPNALAPLMVLATSNLTEVILLESSLSFLGVGIKPPTPSWGAMLGDGRNYLNTAWWVAVFPGIAIVLVTMAISLVGDWLRDETDPRLRGNR